MGPSRGQAVLADHHLSVSLHGILMLTQVTDCLTQYGMISIRNAVEAPTLTRLYYIACL